MIIGPMFAGKSTELLRRMDRHRFSGKKCLYVKYAEDVRYDV
jgi:thymidine kinase